MAVSRALKRLLRIRDLEEEQCQIALAAATSELRRLELALMNTAERKRRGRRMIEASIRQNDVADRIAGMEEQEAADRLSHALSARIQFMQDEVVKRREAYMEKRVERRQVETLLEESAAQEKLEQERKAQRGLDDWYSSRLYQRSNAEDSSYVAQKKENKEYSEK